MSDLSLFNLEQRKLQYFMFMLFKNIQSRENIKYDGNKENITYDDGYVRMSINMCEEYRQCNDESGG